MKKYFLFIALLFGYTNLSAQQFLHYLPIDSARNVIKNAKTSEDKFYGYYGADRYYMNTGFIDSSEFAEKEMYTIAKTLNRDSLFCDVYAVISNRYLLKQDFNDALIYALKALDNAKEANRKGRAFLTLAAVYAGSGNYDIALEYLRKLDALGNPPIYHLFSDLYYGKSFNGLQKPDSALKYLQQTEVDYNVRPDVNGYVQALVEMAKAYALKNDTAIATVYYKKALQFCKENNAQALSIVIGNPFCHYLIAQKNYAAAKQLALKDIELAKNADNFIGIAMSAEILQKVYNQNGDRDSAYQYALIQIAHKDSATNRMRNTEFQNLTFSQKLKAIDEAARVKLQAEERHQNIQYALIASGIIIFITFFLLVSRTIVVNERWISFFTILGLLGVFEFINLLILPWLSSFTHESPILMLLAMVLIASLIIPLHHKLEHRIKEKMIAKNKAIRLAAAKKTIEKLGGDKNQTN